MTSTPPPTSLRAHTPPTPLHGPQHDRYSAYSPRRSTRATALSNPYSSFNSDRSPLQTSSRDITPPPTTNKKHARFARAQLSSPPSSPASPVKRHSLHKTPRKSASSRKISSFEIHSDSDHTSTSLAPTSTDPTGMLPTPSKTPNKRGGRAATVQSTARILSFRPDDPNDVMPSPRKIKKYSNTRRENGLTGFELYEEDFDGAQGSRSKIQIFTDTNARVPEMDEAEDNPFIGSRKNSTPQKGGSKRKSAKSAEQVEQDAKMNEAVDRGEGIIYVFRGKKVFRPFKSASEGDDSSIPSSADLDQSSQQRNLRRMAGRAAQRPLTRSSIKPRLLFPTQDPTSDLDEVDEEAVTDIEMPDMLTSPPKKLIHTEIDVDVDSPDGLATPTTKNHPSKPITPPTTVRVARKKNMELTPILEDDPGHTSATADDTSPLPFATTRAGGKTKQTPSPFDSWQRVKAGSKKREGDQIQSAGGSKRTRSGVMESSL